MDLKKKKAMGLVEGGTPEGPLRAEQAKALSSCTWKMQRQHCVGVRRELPGMGGGTTVPWGGGMDCTPRRPGKNSGCMRQSMGGAPLRNRSRGWSIEGRESLIGVKAQSERVGMETQACVSAVYTRSSRPQARRSSKRKQRKRQDGL